MAFGPLRNAQPAWRDWLVTGAAAFALVLGMWLRTTSVIVSGAALLALSAGLRFRRARRDRLPRLARFSLVLLHERGRYLDRHVLAAIAAEAWGVELVPDDVASRDDFPREAPTFRIRMPAARLLVRTLEEPYWEQPEDVARHFGDLRARRSILSHRAWTAVDVLAADLPPARAVAFGRAAKLTAELAIGSGPLAVFDAESGAFRVWDHTSDAGLREGQPGEFFAGGGGNAVVALAPDDPSLLAAMAEARRRWPEFVAQFKARHPEQHFSVKAPVTRSGQTEHIWIEVTALSDAWIRGRLGNAPIDLPGLRLGDLVSVTTDSVEDWLYVLSSTPIGGFSIPVVERARRRPEVAPSCRAV